MRHLLALRWLNPAADVQLVKQKDSAPAVLEYELWSGETKSFEIKPRFTPELVIAKVMMAARDPELDHETDAADAAEAAAGGAGGDLLEEVAQAEAGAR